MQTISFLVSNPDQLQEKLLKTNRPSGTSSLIQVYSTQSPAVVTEYSRLLSAAVPDAVIIGQSTRCLIKDGELCPYGTLVLLTTFSDVQITSASQHYSADHACDSLSLERQLQLGVDTRAIISFAIPVSSGEHQLYSAFDVRNCLVPVGGGVADATEHGHWVLYGNRIITDGYAAAALHSPQLHVWQNHFHEWNAIGRQFTVTETQGNRVLSLDHKPVHSVYNHYLADNHAIGFQQLKNFPLLRGEHDQQNIFFPAGLHDDGSIEFQVPEDNLHRPLVAGDEVRFCYNHPSLTIEQVRLAAYRLSEQFPDSIFVYNCCSRLAFMPGNSELTPFDEISKAQGAYCAGELCRDAGSPKVMHHSLTYLAMREGDIPAGRSPAPVPENKNPISPLFSLIRNAINDIDAMQKTMEQQLAEKTQKLTDSYRVEQRTSLPNRVALRERLASMSLNEHMVCIKLNNFTQINEKYGYQVGDQLLRDLSYYCKVQLQEKLDYSCQLFSIGVGEWAALFKSGSSSATLRRQFYEFAEQIEHINFKPHGLPEIDYLSVSVTGGLFSRRDYPGASVDDILLKSIEARRHAMKNNRHMCNAKVLQHEMDSKRSQLGWLSCVSRAVVSDQVIAYSQPIVEAYDHQVSSLECLVRIKEGDQIIPPGKFLPVIEGTHMYTRLSRQMISRTFKLMKERSEAFSINLSPQDMMSDNTIRLLEKHLITMGTPQRVGLEVLETEQIKDYGRMIEVCDHLRTLGARIIVDDFGSGYSNIDEIIKLEPQIIKIDGSLIRNIDTDERQRKIAQTMVQLCHVFGAKTVAEFVHNEQVCTIAEDMGVDYLQGYYLGRPELLS